MGKPYKRTSDGRWAADYTDAAGTRKYVYGTTKRECQERLAAAHFRQAQGRSAADSRQTLAAFLQTWLETDVQHNTRANTQASYRNSAQHASRLLGGMRLADLKPVHIQRAYADLHQEGKSGTTVQHVHHTLRIALQRAVEWELLSRNPAASVRPPKRSTVAIRVLTEAEAASLLRQSRGTPHHLLWHLLLTTGLRISESNALTWADLSLDAGTLSIKKTLIRGGRSAVVQDTPKTAASNRLVHLTPSLITELRATKAVRRAVESEWVFPAALGGPLSRNVVQYYLERALLAAGLPHISPHDLRHTCATMLLARSVHPKYVQEMLGHASITQTLDTYSHLTPGMHRPITDIFERMFDPMLSDSLSEAETTDAESRGDA